MPQLTTITQAARNALAAWLLAEFPPSAAEIEPRWFETGRALPPKAISIIDAGPRRIDWTDPEQLIVTPNGASLVDVTWGLGYVDQRVQLDVWAQSDVELDDLMARLDVSLNAGRRPIVGARAEPLGVGVLLRLGDGWAPGTVDFTFDEPSTDETADLANQSEWRGMYRGLARMQLTQVATSARMARINLLQRLTASGITFSSTVSAATPPDT